MHPEKLKPVALALTTAITSIVLGGVAALAQSQQMSEKLMAIKQNQAANKQKLAQYTWHETETISLKGEVKDTKVYQVRMGPNGPEKNEISEQKAQSGGGREGRLKKHVIEKKSEEFQEYGQQI